MRVDPTRPAAHPATSRQREWTSLALLGLVFAVSSGDRAILGVLKTTLAGVFGLTQEDYARLVATLLLSYALTLPLVGGTVNRHGPRLVLTICLGLMSLATAVFGLARSFPHLLIAQMALGLAQAGIAPTIALIIITRFPPERHAVGYSTVNALQSVASILCPTFVAAVTLTLGWRYAFLVPAGVGVGVAVLWWQLGSALLPLPGAEPLKAIPASTAKTPLHLPAVRAVLLARMISDPFWFFLQFWQAAFLREQVGLNLEAIGRLAWIPPLAAVLGVLGFSLASDRLVCLGCAPVRARLQPLWWTATLALAALPLPLVRSTGTAIALCSLLNVMCGVWLSLSGILLGSLVPRSQLAFALGLMSSLGCAAGILFNLAVGPLIDRWGYAWPFWGGAGLYPLAAGVLAWHFRWSRPPPEIVK